ncbi:MAG: acyl carrier protein [Gallionellaceae bacterium]|jgi:acyl carrier protein
MNIEKRVIKVIAEVIAIESDQIKPESSLAGELNCDSLDMLEIAMALESEFSCSIDDEVALKLITVQQVICHMDVIMNGVEKPEVQEHPYPTRQELVVAVASYMNVSAEKATKWLESEFAAGAA